MLINKCKIISVLIVFFILATTGGYALAVPPDVEDTDLEEAVSVLQALDIMAVSSSDGDFEPDGSIMRREFASVICKLLGQGESARSGADTPFSDVPQSDPDSGSIAIAAGLGNMGGYGDGTFGPNDPIESAQAVKVLVSILGYDMIAQASGGYPMGYLSVAKSRGIIGEIGAAENHLTRGELAQMAYHSLNVDMAIQTGFGDERVFSVFAGRTLLTENLDCEKIEGIVTATEDTTLAGESYLQEGEVEIGREVFKVGTTDAKELLGHYVIAYVRIDRKSEGTIAVILQDKGINRVLDVAAENIVAEGTDRTNLRYFDKDESKEKDADISKTAYLIYNGVAAELTDESYIKPSSGKVKLIDNNKDGIYDVIVVYSYETWVVDSVSASTFSVYDKYRERTILELDPSSGDYTCRIIKDGTEVDISAISEWNVLSVATSLNSNKKIKTVIVVNYKLEGEVTEVLTEDTKRSVKIKGREYIVSDSYSKEINVGDEGVFYLNIDGHIAGAGSPSGNQFGYAVLCDVALSKDLDSSIKLKLFTADDGMGTFESVAKVRLNGEIRTADEIVALLTQEGDAEGIPVDSNGYRIYYDEGRFVEVGDNGNWTFNVIATQMGVQPFTTITKRQLVAYRLNREGRVTDIETVGGSSREGSLVMRDRFFNVTGANKILRYNRSTNGFSVAYVPLRTNSPSFFINTDTIIFAIPRTDIADDEEYLTKRPGSYGEDDLCWMETYGFEGDSFLSMPKIVIEYTYKSDEQAAGIAQSPILIDRITSTVDSEGETLRKLYGFQNGAPVFFEAKDEAVFADLEKGDLIQMRVNESGYASAVSRNKANASAPGQADSILFDVRPSDGTTPRAEHIANQKVIYGEQDTDRQIVCGDVFDINFTTKKIALRTTPIVQSALKEEIISLWDISFNNLRVYLHDEAKNRTMISSIDEIALGDLVVMKLTNDQVRDLVIYRLKY